MQSQRGPGRQGQSFSLSEKVLEWITHHPAELLAGGLIIAAIVAVHPPRQAAMPPPAEVEDIPLFI
jgi:hypothetical protein